MSNIVEQVRDGLNAKVEGIQTALMYVKDAREVERLQKELEGATAALNKLNEPDTRSAEEIEKLSEMLKGEAEVDVVPWDKMSPIDKFKYQVELYSSKLDEAFSQASESYSNMCKVVKHVKKTKGDSALFMNPIIEQLEKSLVELNYSRNTLSRQLSVRDDAMKLVEDGDFFNKLTLLNVFLNNPMSLPHLSEESRENIKELEDGEV